MKWSAFLVSCFLFFVQAGSPLEDKLVAHYSFDDCTAVNVLGTGSNGREFGQPDCACGVVNNALYFDGVDDYVEFPGAINSVLNHKDYTIAFYFKTYAVSIKQSLISKRSICELTKPYFELRYFNPCGSKKAGRIYAEVAESNMNRLSKVGELQADLWKHVVWVRSGHHYSMYINGELDTEGKLPKAENSNTANDELFAISNSPCVKNDGDPSPNYRLIGAMDELRIYKAALSAEEVKTLYQEAPVQEAEQDCAT